MVESVGGMVEAVPPIVHSFPTLALLLSGDKRMEVIGTFDRMHYSPYRFAGAIVPECSIDYHQLVAHAKMLASVLLRKNVMGYIMIDFLVFRDVDSLRIYGFDLRINAYPALLMNVYMTLCAGFNEETGRMVLLKNVGHTVKSSRWAVIQNGATHPGMGLLSMKDIKKTCFSEGMFFDLLTRTGFQFRFFDAPSRGKNFALAASMGPESALKLMEKIYVFLLKLFGKKAGSDSGSSMACALSAIHEYVERVFPQ
jgi:hypothetical protein